VELFQSLLNKYQQVDKRLGGWLPGGGTAAPVTRKVQELTRSLTPTVIRNNVVVPVLDKGIATGIIPTAPGMFARYLTGTNKPLTEFPPSMHQGVRQDLNIVDNQIPKYEDIYGSAMSGRAKQLWNEAWSDKKEKAVADVKSQQGLLGFLRKNDQNWLETRAQVSPIVQEEYQRLLEQDTSPEKTKALAAKEAYLKAANNQDLNAPFPVTHSNAYRDGRRGPSTLTLGSFTVNPGSREVIDQYKFDDLDKGKNLQGLYPDALAGGKPAAFLIDFALNKGLITPQSGYNIRAKY
jgi:hypothetical protein